ncbi:MAG: hypothetical protein V5A24_08680 [Haloarculaceae archaeon]
MTIGDGWPAGYSGDPGRKLLRGAGLGFALGAGGVVAGAAVGMSVRDANGVVFPLAAMVFGVGIAAWASVSLYGTSLERGARRAEISDTFTTDRAAAVTGRLAVAGLSGMVGGTVASIVISRLVA